MFRIQLGILLSALVAPISSHAEVSFSGSTTVFLTAVKNVKDEVSKSTGVAITATGSTTGKGFSALQAKQVDVAMSADSLKSLIDIAATKGVALKADDYEEVFLKDTFLVAIGHRANPLSALTETQIQGILNGDIKGWKELGGHDLPVAVYFEKEQSANFGLIKAKFFKDKVLQAKRLTYVDNVRLVVTSVAETESGFGITPEMYLNDQVKVISSCKIGQHLCFIIRKDASPEVRQVVAAFKSKI